MSNDKMAMKVRKEWLCDENNNIVYKPLSFWFKYFGLKPIDGHLCCWKAEANDKEVTFRGAVLIEVMGGYAMTHNGYEEFKDDLFFVANADLDTPKLRMKL